LTVTSNQLTLTTTNGDHGVGGLDTSHRGLVDETTQAGKDTRALEEGTTTFGNIDRTLSIDGASESVNDTSRQLQADWDMVNPAGMLDSVAFLDKMIVIEDGDIDVVGITSEQVTKEYTLYVLETPEATDIVTNIYKTR
jgi:hypothetical protein